MSSTFKRNISFIAIIIGFFMALLDSTIVNIALPKITEYYNTSVDNISWVVNGYNLAFAVFIITAARLADQFGRKKVFIIGVFLFTLSSFLSALAPNAGFLIALRVVQGLSGAIVVPVTIPLAANLFPKEKHGMVIGIWGAISGLASASGPALGGLLTNKFYWQSIFYVNVPLGLISIILSIILLKESYDSTTNKKIDWGGVITISLTMFCTTFALIKANDFGWTSMKIISLFVASFIALLGFIIVEMKSQNPMLPLWILRIKAFDGAALTLFVIGAATMNGIFLMSFFLTQIMHMTILQAGITVSAAPLASILFSAVAGPLSNKYGSRWFAVVGVACIILSIFTFSTMNADSTRLDAILRLALLGVGLGISMPPVISSAIRNVPDDKVGMASALTNMTRALGAVLGVAVIVTVLNSNIAYETGKIKNEAVTLVNSNKVISADFKKAVITNIEDYKMNSSSKKIDTKDFMKIIETQEKSVLSKLPSEKRKGAILLFEKQNKELMNVFSDIFNNIKVSTAEAFRRTFQFSGFLLIIGLLFAFFSDTKHRKNANTVNEIIHGF